jgi:hypothetical protein
MATENPQALNAKTLGKKHFNCIEIYLNLKKIIIK